MSPSPGMSEKQIVAGINALPTNGCPGADRLRLGGADLIDYFAVSVEKR
jgi:hypothetical protein